MDICTPLQYYCIKKGVRTNTPLISVTPIKSMPLILSFLPKKKPFLDTYLTLSLNIFSRYVKIVPLDVTLNLYFEHSKIHLLNIVMIFNPNTILFKPMHGLYFILKRKKKHFKSCSLFMLK